MMVMDGRRSRHTYIYPILWQGPKIRGSALLRFSAPRHRKTTRYFGESHTIKSNNHRNAS